MAFETVPVEKTGTRSGCGFVMRNGRCQIEAIATDVYPPSPDGERLRGERMRLGLSLGQASRVLDMNPADFSGLETGRRKFCDPADWTKAVEALRYDLP